MSGNAQRQATPSRGQTEPLAALVAVAAVCLAVSTYAGTLSGVVPALDSERTVGEGTAQRVWHQLAEDGIYTADSPLGTEIQTASLPRGYYVTVNVTCVCDDGRLDSVASGQFGPDGESSTAQPPADAERFERPVALRLDRGEVRPGRLSVVVWNAD